MIRVVLEIHAPPEVAERLAWMAVHAPDVSLGTAHGSFPARLGGDTALLDEAATVVPRYLTAGGLAAEQARYWLRTAAEVAYRARRDARQPS